jgi:hypothetical protein
MSKKIMATGFSNSKKLPEAKESYDKKLGFQKWGLDNQYPFYLVDMYNGSAWHQGIIKTKTYYVAGGGLEVVNGQLDEFLKNANSDYTIDEMMKKVAFDFELFDGFCVVGSWNRDGTKVVRWEHFDVDRVRTNIDESSYFFSNDWSARKQTKEDTNFREIKPLDLEKREGKFVIYYKSPSKQTKGDLGTYPKPSYIGGITDINADLLISKYHYYEISNGFKVGTLINFANGTPESKEEENAIVDQVKGTSTSIEDVNEVIITFSDGNENAPSVLSLNGNDLADRYNLTEKSIQQNILVAHSATNPMLFGIKTEGQLGGATELLESFEIFKSIYVNGRQKTLTWVLDKMIELSGEVGTVQFIQAMPMEIKKEEVPEEMTQEFRSADDDLKIFRKYGKEKSEFIRVKSVSVSNDFGSEQVKQFESDNFKHFFDEASDIQKGFTGLDKSVLSLLKKGEDGSSISKAIEVPMKDIAESMDKLTKLNLISKGETSKLGELVLDGLEVEIDQFEVRYSYEVKPGLGAEVIPTTREFCETFIDINRMYLRSEIDMITGSIGRDVWRYRGGWYNNKKTGRTTPWCRHEWRQHLVIKK